MSEYIAKCTEVIGISGKPINVPDYIDLNSEIVRCRDCRHIVWTDNPFTRTHYWCIEYDRLCSLDDFCSWAERRESGGIESIYDWPWVREVVGEEEAERRKEQQREEESE